MGTRIYILLTVLMLINSSCGDECLKIQTDIGPLDIQGNIELIVSCNPNDTITFGDTLWIISTFKPSDIFSETNYCDLDYYLENGDIKFNHYFSVIRNNELILDDCLNNFPYCSRLAVIGDVEYFEPCFGEDEIICREYFVYNFNAAEKLYELKIACIFNEPGEYSFGGWITVPEMEELDMLTIIKISTFSVKGFIYSVFPQTGTKRFPLTVVARK